MLLQFTVGNYLSFKGQETFSLVATDQENMSDNYIELNEDLRILKTTAIYGANASGKSNLFSALGFMQDFIINSFRKGDDKEEISTIPFKLDANSRNKPSFFELDFYINKKIHTYGFEVTPTEVVKEWLYVEDELLYERKGMELTEKSQELDQPNEIALVWNMTKKNVLFLSILANAKINFANDIFNYIKRRLMINIGVSNSFSHYTKFLLDKGSEKITKDIESFLKQLDLNILELSIEKDRDWESIIPDNIGVSEELKSSLKYNGMKIKTTHNIYNDVGEVKGTEDFLADILESDGTKQVIAFSGPILTALKTGGVLFIDEMDAQLHPLLSANIIKLFNSSKNKLRAQLIITTHNVTNLRNDIFRSDQIWFVEKDFKECSHIVALSDYKLEPDEDFKNKYLKGKYGAIPLLAQEITILEDNFKDIRS